MMAAGAVVGKESFVSLYKLLWFVQRQGLEGSPEMSHFPLWGIPGCKERSSYAN